MLAASFLINPCFKCGGEQNDSHVSGLPSMLETLSP